MSHEVLIASLPELHAAIARRFERLAAEAIAERGRFAIALSGGSMAEEFFPQLSRCGIDWSCTEFFWIDERAVPPDDERSNFALADRIWLRPAAVPPANVHRLRGEAADLEEAAIAGERELVEVLGSPPRIDLVWLGVGDDGHVASLFPGHSLLGERQRQVAAVYDSPKPPARRLTLTLPAIAAARHVAVTAFGPGKSKAIGEALRNPDSRLPLSLALAVAATAWVTLDPDAARDLDRT